jgi:hypothetical protein
MDPDNSRLLASIEKNPDAEKKIQNIYGEIPYGNVEDCEGLTFSSNAQFEDLNTGETFMHAFKLSDKKLRLLMMVECNVSVLKEAVNQFHLLASWALLCHSCNSNGSSLSCNAW